MSSTLATDLAGIISFCEHSKVQFLSTHCSIKKSEIGGLGVFATQDIDAGKVLLRLPKSSVFSASNSSIANLLFDAEIDGMLALNLAFIYETTIFKDRSHWYDYLKSIKIEDEYGKLYLPPSYWPINRKAPLNGTALDTLFDALTPEQEIKESYDLAAELVHKWKKEFGLPIPEELFSSDETENIDLKFLKFVATAYALSSRAFEIDSYHESGLVCIADLFNHHVSSPDVRFESLYDVCDRCGEMGPCGHVIPDEEPMEGFISPQSTEKESSEGGVFSMELVENLEKEMLDDSSVTDSEKENADLIPDECVDMTLKNSVKAGSEIFNSYGDLSNALLLARYGFCISDNVHDVVHIAPDIIKFKKRHRRTYEERFQWWVEIGHELFSNWFHAKRVEDDESDDEDEISGDDYEIASNLSDDEDGTASDAGLESWHSDLYLTSDGQLTPSLRALITLLTLSPSVWRDIAEKMEDEEKISKKVASLRKTARQKRTRLVDRDFTSKAGSLLGQFEKPSEPRRS